MRGFEELSEFMVDLTDMCDYLVDINCPRTLGGFGYEDKSHMHITIRDSYKDFRSSIVKFLEAEWRSSDPMDHKPYVNHNLRVINYVIRFYGEVVCDVELVKYKGDYYLSPDSEMDDDDIDEDEHWYDVLCDAYKEKKRESKGLRK